MRATSRGTPASISTFRLIGWLIGCLLLPALSGWPDPVQAAALRTGDAENPWLLCAREIARAERAQRIPPRLLSAVAQVESGRWNAAAQANFAWPWTVTAEGRGRYLPTKEAAVAEVRKLRARGVSNIDVGCMQVNLHYHPDAFANLGDAFDPARNVAYAARFLRKLRAEKRSWVKAVAHYHSATPALHRPYRSKVYEAWRAERRRADRAHPASPVGNAESEAATFEPGRAGAVGAAFIF